MKNITVSLDDETYRQARVFAAQHDTSVSALVKEFLSELPNRNEFERLKELEREMRQKITSFSCENLLSRDELHERKE